MDAVRFGIYNILCDVDATRLAYERTPLGGAEMCGCLACRNFVTAGERAYPSDVLALFQQLGIDYRRPAHVYTWGRVEDGRYHYEGWFHFVGQVDQHIDAWEQVSDYFYLWFHGRPALISEAFKWQPLGVLEFVNKAVPWVLNTPLPSPDWPFETSQ
ncbi:MAG TPA: hypothetical protein VK066_05045 [Chloroflexota bacterium]|nr:hypothetical protein [Chloroflexota bacterium]